MRAKAIGIMTVEQCAGLSDVQVQRIGMGGHVIRENAKAYLDDSAATAIVSRALADKERLEAENAALKQQLGELRPMMDRMHSDLMALKNAQPATETYVPWLHDPIEQAMRAAPVAPLAPSSLDSLRPPARKGRPPGSPNRVREEVVG